jgi:hypothetical protein
MKRPGSEITPASPSRPNPATQNPASSTRPIAPASGSPAKGNAPGSNGKSVTGRISSSLAKAGSAVAKPFKQLGKAAKGLAQKVTTPSRTSGREPRVEQIGSKRYQMGETLGKGEYGFVQKARQVKFKNPITGKNVLTGPTLAVKEHVYKDKLDVLFIILTFIV